MHPFSQAHTEIELFVGRLKLSAKRLEEPGPAESAWEEHFIDALVDLWSTFDRIQTGLGLAFICALFPNGARYPSGATDLRNAIQQRAVEHVVSGADGARTPEGGTPR